MKKKLCLLSVLSLSAIFFTGLGLSACDNPKQPQNQESTQTFTLSQDKIDLSVGSTVTLSVTVQEGEVVGYYSTNETVATVSENGEITAHSTGLAFIVVTAGEQTKSCLVSVSETGYAVRLNYTELELVAGAVKTIDATVTENGELTEEVVTFTAEGDAVSLTSVGNSVIVTADKTGVAVIKVQSHKATAICKIKVMSDTAETLDAPVLSVENCDCIAWTAVSGATVYTVKINDGVWQKTADTFFSCTAQADTLEEYTVSVRAIAEQSVNYYGSDVAKLTVSHSFIQTAGESATCVSPADIEFRCEICTRGFTEKNQYGAHAYENGICNVCKAYETLNLPFTYDETLDGYVLGRCKNVLPSTLKVIVVPETYDDGVNGEKPVVRIGDDAFQSMVYIEKVILPDTVVSIGADAFLFCRSLHTVYMAGVSGNGGFTGGNAFLDCPNLTKIVVSPDFTTKTIAGATKDEERQTFLVRYIHDKEYYAKLNVYVFGSDKGDGFYAKRTPVNNMFTGKVIYYDENATCGSGTWKYDENGDVSYAEHNFHNGVCMVCGAYDDEGLTYEYDAELDGYLLLSTGEGFTGNVIMPKAQFNDGKNGVKNVIAVQDFAFANCYRLEKVVFPDTLTQVRGTRGNIFMQCYALNFVDLGGIISFNGGGNEFLDCFNLKKLVVAPGFKVKSSEQRFLLRDRRPAEVVFSVNCIDYAGTMDLYVKAEEITETSIAVSAKNNLYSGNVYCFSDVSACGKWYYNESGEPTSRNHDFSDGVSCKFCGLKAAKDIAYKFDATQGGYVVSGFVDGYSTEILELSSYDDGINGEYPVVAIAAGAFKGNTAVRKLILPRTVTKIGESAFEGCTALTYVQMEGVNLMSGTNAFNNCTALRTLIVGRRFALVDRNFWSNNTTAGSLDLYVSDYNNGDAHINLQPCFEGSEYSAGHTRNDLFSLKVYKYSSNTSTAGGWTYVDGVATANDENSYYQITGANTFIDPVAIGSGE